MLQSFNLHEYRSSFEESAFPRLAYSCKTQELDAKMPRAMHMHRDTAELVLITAGSGTHLVGERRYVSTAGDLLIYNAGTLHDEIASPGEGVSTYCAAITGLWLRGLPEGCLLHPSQDALLHTGERYADFRAVFNMIHAEVNAAGGVAGELLHYLARLLVVMVGALTRTAQSNALSPEQRTTRDIRALIDERYMDNLTLEEIARQMHLSRYYLSRLFRSVEGTSPMRYLARRRIGEAQSLLINTALSVTEIAHMVGYNSSNHFHSMFMKAVGLTPQHYRRYWTSGERWQDSL